MTLSDKSNQLDARASKIVIEEAVKATAAHFDCTLEAIAQGIKHNDNCKKTFSQFLKLGIEAAHEVQSEQTKE